MKRQFIALAWACILLTAPAFVATRQMDLDMSGMQHDVKPADAQGVGVVEVIDTANGTINLQREAIVTIGWPAMTMSFKIASPDLLNVTKVGDKVKFTLHRPARPAR